MKKFLALFLSAVMLLSVFPSAAFAVEYAGSYETALNLAKNDLTNLENLNIAVTMLGQLGSYSFSKIYLRYFQQVIAVQSERPDYATIRLLLDICADAGDFSADLEERGLPSCAELKAYADAREQEYNGNLAEACEGFRKISLLDSIDRAMELALIPSRPPAEPFSPFFGLSDADFAAAARELTGAAATWTADFAPKSLSVLPLSADEVIRLYRGLREGTSAPERDGQEYRLRCPVDDLLADSTPEAYVELYGTGVARGDGLLTRVGTHTWTFSVPNDSRFDTVGEIRASWDCDWPDVGGTGWNETLTAELTFREGEETAVQIMLVLQNCAFDIAWVPGRTLGGAAGEDSVSVYIRDWQTGKRLGLEFSMNAGRLTGAANDPAFSAWETASGQPKGHVWGEVKYDWSPDHSRCTARRSCRICGFEETETVSSGSAVTRQPTCAAMGVTTYTAQFANRGFSIRQEPVSDIPTVGHEWGTPKYDWSGDCRTCTASRVCRNCGKEQKESVSTSGIVTKQATCKSKGTTTYTATFINSAFQQERKSVDDIEMTPHSWAPATYTSPETCTVCGITRGSIKASPTPEPLRASRFNGSPYNYTSRPFSWAYASSEFRQGNIVFSADYAIDAGSNRPWVEGAPGHGIGETLTLCFPGETKIQVLELWLGYVNGAERYNRNNRPKELRFSFSDGSSVTYTFKDKEFCQSLLLSKPIWTTYVEIEILSVYAGKDDDTCITLVNAYG